MAHKKRRGKREAAKRGDSARAEGVRVRQSLSSFAMNEIIDSAREGQERQKERASRADIYACVCVYIA